MFPFLSCADYEKPDYKILKTKENIEIREYPSIILAEVKMKDNNRAARNKGFKKLFQYITGANEQSQDIKMTVPVLQSQTGSSEWSMSFIIPKKWEWGKVPQPANDDINIKQLESQKMAVIRFQGGGSEKKFSKYQKILEEYLIENNIKYNKDKAIYAYYNSPFTLWFMKMHEVLFVIETEEVVKKIESESQKSESTESESTENESTENESQESESQEEILDN